MHWDWDWNLDCYWDWNWHHDHMRPWPWSYFYKIQCPLRRRFFSSIHNFDMDFDFCHSDCLLMKGAGHLCHHSCLTGTVYIETGEEVDSCGKGTFKILLDAHHFQANELQLKVRNTDTLILQGKHKDDRANKSPALCITKAFTRKYKLPRYYDATQAKATFSKDGILTVIVPPPPPLDDVERSIDIIELDTYYGSVEYDNNKKRAIEADK